MLYSVSQTAKELNISEVTVRRLIKFKRIPYRKIGDRYLFSQVDISNYLESIAVPAVDRRNRKAGVEA
jgi:excisionase family DNA binding protein